MLKWSPCQTGPPDCCKTLTHVSGFPFRPKINGTILKMKGRDSPGCHVLLLLPVYFKKNYILRSKNDLHKSVDQKREGLNNVNPLTHYKQWTPWNNLYEVWTNISISERVWTRMIALSWGPGSEQVTGECLENNNKKDPTINVYRRQHLHFLWSAADVLSLERGISCGKKIT